MITRNFDSLFNAEFPRKENEPRSRGTPRQRAAYQAAHSPHVPLESTALHGTRPFLCKDTAQRAQERKGGKSAKGEQAMLQMEAEVPFGPCDLPGYAARLVRLHEWLAAPLAD
jgi:hypothetical protein